jgi:hypothetical protein
MPEWGILLGPPYYKHRRSKDVALRKIVIIGVGSFGGFLCKHLSEIESVEQIYVIDDDIIEPKNIKTSVYRIAQIGEYKVDALVEMFKDDISILGFATKYIEGKTILPKADLVIDCRDVVCDRGTDIDVRFYISGRSLVIDSRKNVKCPNEYQGSYSINLAKNEISKASFFAAQIIGSKQIENLRKNYLIKTVDLDVLPEILNKSIKETLENRSDILYEVFDQTNRIYGLEENIEPIMTINQKADIPILIPNRTELILPKRSLHTTSDLIEKLTELVKSKNNFRNFIIVLRERNGEKYVELLEETGGS